MNKKLLSILFLMVTIYGFTKPFEVAPTPIAPSFSFAKTTVSMIGSSLGTYPDVITAIAAGNVRTSTPKTSVTGITRGTSYDANVRTDFGGDGVSPWSIAKSFTTLNSANDTDGDGIPNNLDVDDDNDGILDSIENQQGCEPVTEWNRRFYGSGAGFNSGVSFPGNSVVIGDNQSGGYAEYNSADLGVTGNFRFSFTLDQVNLPSTRSFSMSLGESGTNEDGFSGSQYYFIFNENSSINIGGVILAYYPTAGDVFSMQRLGTVMTYLINDEIVATAPDAATQGDYYIELLFESWYGAGSSLSDLTVCNDIDIDNDGILNSLDLDSDNDGCPDAKEAGFTGVTLLASGANANDGITDNTAEAVIDTSSASWDTDGNGFADALETAPGNGIINYTISEEVQGLYNFLNANLNNCFFRKLFRSND